MSRNRHQELNDLEDALQAQFPHLSKDLLLQMFFVAAIPSSRETEMNLSVDEREAVLRAVNHLRDHIHRKNVCYSLGQLLFEKGKQEEAKPYLIEAYRKSRGSLFDRSSPLFKLIEKDVKKNVRLSRQKADQLVKGVYERAIEINLDDNWPICVTRLALFGSYLTEKESLGDLDLAIEFYDKPWMPAQKIKEIKASMLAESHFTSLVDELFCAEIRTQQRIRAKSTGISIIPFKMLVQMRRKEDLRPQPTFPCGDTQPIEPYIILYDAVLQQTMLRNDFSYVSGYYRPSDVVYRDKFSNVAMIIPQWRSEFPNIPEIATLGFVPAGTVRELIGL